MKAVGIAIALAITAATGAASAENISLAFGGDIGIGFARESDRSANLTSATYPGVALAAEVGAAITSQFTAGVRVVAIRGGDAQPLGDFYHVTTTFLGAFVDYKPVPRLHAGLGIGLGEFDDPVRAGYSLDLRLSYDVWCRDAHSIHVGLESTPMYVPKNEAHDSRELLNVAIVVGYAYPLAPRCL